MLEALQGLDPGVGCFPAYPVITPKRYLIFNTVYINNKKYHITYVS